MIKKILFGFALLATVASCTDDYTDWGQPQSNPQEDAVAFGDGSVAPVGLIDFANIPEGQEMVQVCTITAPTASDELYKPEYKIILGENEYDINANGEMSVADLESYVISTFGRRPVEREIDASLSTWVNNGSTAVKLTSGVFKITAKPEAPYISDAYYLVGDMVGWDEKGMVKFAHSDADVYEDPVFTIMFTTNGANKHWKIIPQTNIDNGDFWAQGKTGVVGVAVDGDPSMSGTLTTDAPQAGKIENPGMYKMTINMMDYSYTIEPVAPQYYIVGAIQGWSDSKKTHLFTPVSSTELSYTTKWTGAWDLKFWNSNDFGNWDNAYGCAVDGDNSASGSIIGTSAQAISAPSAEYYTFTIDMANMKYTWTKLADQNPTEYSTIGLIGDFNGWSGDVAMTQVAPHNWYVVATVADGGLKFRANSDWAVSWGADLTVSDTDFYAIGSTDNAPNINVPAGTYAFYLNDITKAIQIVKQ